MIVVMRCLSCGKPIAHLYEEFKKRTANGEAAADVLDSLGLSRYCCRAAFMGTLELVQEIGKFKKS